jgi:secreted trypsin-like serine protease
VRRASSILIATLTASLIGCTPAEKRTAAESSRSRSITNGTVDQGDSAVVALLSSGEAYCTGTVIADRWVLTAGHCLQPPLSPSEVYMGRGPTTDGVRLVVARTVVHPRFSFIGLENDVGLVELVESAPVTPVPLMEEQLDEGSIGALVRLVGFGSSSGADRESGVKRSGTAEVSSLDPQKLTVLPAPSQPCLSDSGAPVLLPIDGVERVVGVSSSGDAQCQDHARAVRVDAVVDDFILPAIGGSASSYGCQSVADRAPDLSLFILALAFFRRAVSRHIKATCGTRVMSS